jgi:thiol-disulfide isomerase/thioredoxin
MKPTSFGVIALFLCFAAPLSAQPVSAPAAVPVQGLAQQEPIPKVYAPKVDSSKEIAQALKRAKKENKRVLIQFGGNWCHWCFKLHQLFASDYKVSTQLSHEFEVVHVDIGNFNKNLDLVNKYRAPVEKEGVPYLVVLDANGKVVQRQGTRGFEKGDQHDPKLILAFLVKVQAPRLDAFKVFDGAKGLAKKQGKPLFLHVGAPWCGWCYRLEGFLALPRVEQLLQRYFVLVKIDQDRMTNSKKLIATFRDKSSVGIPWYAIFDSSGLRIVTSDGPKGNAGCPVEKFEVQHFMYMLRLGSTKMTAKELAEIEATLQAYGKKFRRQQ